MAALKLFVEKGYDGTSIRDVADAANVNLAAISYHFGGKAGLHEFLEHSRNEVPSFAPPG